MFVLLSLSIESFFFKGFNELEQTVHKILHLKRKNCLDRKQILEWRVIKQNFERGVKDKCWFTALGVFLFQIDNWILQESPERLDKREGRVLRAARARSCRDWPSAVRKLPFSIATNVPYHFQLKNDSSNVMCFHFFKAIPHHQFVA